MLTKNATYASWIIVIYKLNKRGAGCEPCEIQELTLFGIELTFVKFTY